MYNVRIPFLQKKVNYVPQKARISLAIILGALIVVLSHYGYKRTGADIFLAEMFHATASTLTITFLLVSVYTRGWPLTWITKINGLSLLLASVTVGLKAYTTFGEIALGKTFALKNTEYLLFIGTILALTSLLQMLLVWNERRLLLGEKNTFPDFVTSKQKNSVTVTDGMQVFACTIEYILITAIPLTPLFGRFIDLMFTLWMTLWLFKRGIYILAPKEKRRDI